VPFFCPFFVLCLATRFGFSVNLSKASFLLASNYTGLDNMLFWGVIQTPPSADETFIFMEAIFTPPRLGGKARFS
jgi:hypothetical protein